LQALIITDNRFVEPGLRTEGGFVGEHDREEDGNGRIHRYLFHHVLAEKEFVPKGLISPVSAVILEKITAYRKTLEHFSRPRLDFIEWHPTAKNNVEILNDTIDLYRYFDATAQAEFFFDCVEETVNKTLPEEVEYLKKYDRFTEFIKNHIDMPDNLANLLLRFLSQNNGSLSKKARDGEFEKLTNSEVQAIEQRFTENFS